ncbi:MAG: hypothetical protein JXA13_05740 [Anaerolineales bacterium]|nr:hypothetical protein [Anaerolineales bacterium]
MKTSPPTSPKHNSYRIHQRQFVVQILLPLILLLSVLIAAGFLMTYGASGQARPWADIAAMLLILPVLALGLVILVLVTALIILTGRLIKILPPYSAIAQEYAQKVPLWLRKAADKVAEPLIWVKSKSAMVKKLTKRS